MDRGYDDNDIFRLLDRLGQTYVIRLKLNRKIRVNGKKYSIQELCANCRVRSLTAINSLNFFLSACMLFLATIKETSDRNMLFRICVEAAAPLKPKVYFFYYRLVVGLHFILSKAHTGIRGYFKTLRPNQRQMKIRGFT